MVTFCSFSAWSSKRTTLKEAKSKWSTLSLTFTRSLRFKRIKKMLQLKNWKLKISNRKKKRKNQTRKKKVLRKKKILKIMRKKLKSLRKKLKTKRKKLKTKRKNHLCYFSLHMSKITPNPSKILTISKISISLMMNPLKLTSMTISKQLIKYWSK